MKFLVCFVLFSLIFFISSSSGKKVLHRHKSHTSEIEKLLDGILSKIASDESSERSTLDKTFKALDQDQSDRSSDVAAQQTKINSKKTVVQARQNELDSLLDGKARLEKRNTKANAVSDEAKRAAQAKLAKVFENHENEKKLVAQIKKLLGAHFTDGSSRASSAPSCRHVKQQVSNAQSGKYWIKSPSMDKAYHLECDMSRKGGGWIVLHHNGLEAWSVQIHGYEAPGLWKKTTQYKLAKKPLLALLKDSEKAEQLLDKKCRGSGIWPSKTSYSWWSTIKGRNVKSYWPNHSTCDRNDGTWRRSAGMITRKIDLPIAKVFIGDTGNKNEYAKIRVGPLYLY